MTADPAPDAAQLMVFRVLFDPDRTRIDIDADVMGWGVLFPSGDCAVDWNRAAYPPDDRLDHPHLSLYGSLDDVQQGTGGVVEPVHTFTFDGDGDGDRSGAGASGGADD